MTTKHDGKSKARFGTHRRKVGEEEIMREISFM